ncbi:hypothetical protein, partial [Thermus scotoductus]
MARLQKASRPLSQGFLQVPVAQAEAKVNGLELPFINHRNLYHKDLPKSLHIDIHLTDTKHDAHE